MNTNPIAVAIMGMKPKLPERPPRPANRSLKPRASMPGASILFAVAIPRARPSHPSRPPRPAKICVKPIGRMPGAPFAVANIAVQTIRQMRPPRAAVVAVEPTRLVLPAPISNCGRHFPGEAHPLAATAAPGQQRNEAQLRLAGRSFQQRRNLDED